MLPENDSRSLEAIKFRYPEKFAGEGNIFAHINPGDRIFIGTGCGEPQYLVKALIQYVRSHPKVLFQRDRGTG